MQKETTLIAAPNLLLKQNDSRFSSRMGLAVGTIQNQRVDWGYERRNTAMNAQIGIFEV